MSYPGTEQLKYSNYTVNLSNILRKISINLLLWSGLDAIINAHDLMQNPGQTRIFYKLSQTHLTQTKHAVWLQIFIA